MVKLTKCGLFFNIVSSAVHTLIQSVLQSLDSSGIEADPQKSPQLQIWPHHRSDTASQPSVFFFFLFFFFVYIMQKQTIANSGVPV